MSTWKFWVGPGRDATQPADELRELSTVAFMIETYFVHKG